MKKTNFTNGYFTVLILFAMMLFLNVNSGNAQENTLLKLSSELESQLTLSQVEAKNEFLSDDLFLSCRIVETNDWTTLLNGNELSFKIPDIEGTFTAKADREEEGNQYFDYLWAGKIENEYPGNILLIKKGNYLAGFIQTKKQFLTIIPYKENAAFLIESNPEKYSEYICGNNEFLIKNEEKEVDPCNEQVNTCEATIDALILMTDEAQLFYDGVVSNTPWGGFNMGGLLTVLGMETVNWAFQNSSVFNKTFRYHFVSYNPPGGFNLPIDIRLDLIDLASDQVANDLLNIDYECDIAIMLTNHGYFPTFGIAYVGPNSGLPFSIVEVPAILNPRWTFAHEVGHLFGALHDRGFNGVGGDDSDCSYAWQFIDSDGQDQRTILNRSGAVNPGDAGARILHYSNPAVDFNGVATGTVDDDNARTIRNTGCDVASFNTNDPVCSPNLSYPGSVCNEDGDFPVSMTGVNEAAPALAGHPPFTTPVWSVNTDDLYSTVSILPNGNNASVSFSCPYGCTLTLSASVISDDGELCKKSVEIEVLPDVSCFAGRSSNDGANEIEAIGEVVNKLPQGVKVYPNPASSTLVILTDGSQNYEFALINLNGEVLKRGNTVPKEEIRIDVGSMESGAYILQFKGIDTVINNKIFITRGE